MSALGASVTRLAGEDISLVARTMLANSLDESPLAGKAVEVIGDIVSGYGHSIVPSGSKEAWGGLAIMDMPQGLADMVKAQGGRLNNVTLEGALSIKDPGTRSAMAGLNITNVLSPHIPNAADNAAADAARLGDLFGNTGSVGLTRG